jgi:hypothetical protein
MSLARPFSLVDLTLVLQNIQDGYSPAQASRQRGVDHDVVSKACAELLRLGNMAFRARGEGRCINRYVGII